MQIPAITIALGAAALAANPALAGDGAVRHERVKVSDEDFANAATMARLQRSIGLAAQRVCLADGDPASLSPDQQRCIDQAISDARADIVRIGARHGVPLPAQASPDADDG